MELITKPRLYPPNEDVVRDRHGLNCTPLLGRLRYTDLYYSTTIHVPINVLNEERFGDKVAIQYPTGFIIWNTQGERYMTLLGYYPYCLVTSKGVLFNYTDLIIYDGNIICHGVVNRLPEVMQDGIIYHLSDDGLLSKESIDGSEVWTVDVMEKLKFGVRLLPLLPEIQRRVYTYLCPMQEWTHNFI
jgi:hypothetical protein